MTPHSETPTNAMNASEGEEVDVLKPLESCASSFGDSVAGRACRDAANLIRTQAATIAELRATDVEQVQMLLNQAMTIKSQFETIANLTARAELAERKCESAIGLLEKLYTIYEDGMSITAELDRNIVDLLNRDAATPTSSPGGET